MTFVLTKKMVSFRIDEELYDKLYDKIKDSHMGISEIVRQAVIQNVLQEPMSKEPVNGSNEPCNTVYDKRITGDYILHLKEEIDFLRTQHNHHVLQFDEELKHLRSICNKPLMFSEKTSLPGKESEDTDESVDETIKTAKERVKKKGISMAWFRM